MSKRPETGSAAMSRPRRPAGRLRDMPIWSKLGLIMLVPTLATIIVGVSGLVDHINGANNAERARTLAVLSQAAGGLVDQLQTERAYGVMVLTTESNTSDRKTAQDAYKTEWTKVDQAKLEYAQQRTTLDNVPDRINTTLGRLDRNLADLPATRTQAYGGNTQVGNVEQVYGDVIADLLSIRDASAQLANDTTLSDHMRTVSAVAQAKEYISQQRDVGYEIVQQQNLTPALRTKFILTQTGYEISDRTRTSVATASDEQLFQRMVAGPSYTAATNLTKPLINLQGSNTGNIPFNRTQWDTAMAGYNGLFRNVESQLDKNIVAEATTLRNNVNRRVFLETSVLLGLLLLAILFAWLVARSMARSLRELRQGALSVAQFGLPHAVSRLRDPSLHQSLTPAQVADQVAEPLPVRSRDEFGQVTEAFNAVHLEAVRTAAEQAALRSSVATMFVNLARRSQILVDRLIGHLDRLERGEEDPDRLAELFQLDHLATRMRRNDENLLVLAGADSTRVQREPAALIDVLRAAQSEVEHYTRIEFGMIDRDVEVAAHAVNDMVHLVAELFDNATAFSPPNSTVLVEARRLGDGAIMSVEDRGIGISREQLRDLNERLANPPMVDVAVSRMMGLVVVARLANRHEVRVELRPADTERGTVAEVVLPATALVGPATAARLQPGETTFGAVAQGPSMRPQSGPPLELESGRPGSAGRQFDPNPPMPSGGMLGVGRSMPAWSDLTGASSSGFGVMNGTNGANGFRRENEPVSGPQAYNGGELPQRRADTDTGYGATIPRQLPANPESQDRPPFVPPVSAPPVPSAPPQLSGPPTAEPPAPANPAKPPPAWPPVAGDREHGAPHVPESLAAALDMTAELPRYRPTGNGNGNGHGTAQPPAVTGAPQDGPQTSAQRAAAAHEAAAAQAAEAHAAAAAQIAAAEAAAQQRATGSGERYQDETMELPIFRELESAWFMTARPQAESARPADADDRVTAQRIPTGEPTPRVSGVPQQPGSRDTAGGEEFRDRDAAPVGAVAAASNPWQTAADEGWQAARAAAEVPIESTTTAGLPKRTPMAQLVPGGVDRGGQSVQRRTPEAVRGLLSAYHRGVQRGRQSTNPEATPGAQQSSQAGKEHEA